MTVVPQVSDETVLGVDWHRRGWVAVALVPSEPPSAEANVVAARLLGGKKIRRQALARDGIELPDVLGEAGAVPVADVLDAAVSAWSARRYARRCPDSLPDGARAGERQVIWY